MSFSCPAVHWDWPPDHATAIDLTKYRVTEWRKHSGDSVIWRVLEQGRQKTITPKFLLKAGTDAIGEKLYSFVACRYDIPSQVVYWGNRETMMGWPTAAIRFEPEALYPEKIILEEAVGILSDGRRIDIRNPLDYFAHLALFLFANEVDSFNFMLLQGVLFRIDAAAAFSISRSQILDDPDWCQRALGYADSQEQRSIFLKIFNLIAADIDLVDVAYTITTAAPCEQKFELADLVVKFIRHRQNDLRTFLSSSREELLAGE